MTNEAKPAGANPYGVALNQPHRRCTRCKEFHSMVAPAGKKTTIRHGKWYCADCADVIRARGAVKTP